MKILFLCMANSARSQMAEGLARFLWKGRAEIESAGANASHVNSYAIKVLQEIGIDISGQFSKSIQDIDLNSVDLIITLCDRDICPTAPARIRKLHWPIEDPTLYGLYEEQRLASFRKTRDNIRARLEKLQTELFPASARGQSPKGQG